MNNPALIITILIFMQAIIWAYWMYQALSAKKELKKLQAEFDKTALAFEALADKWEDKIRDAQDIEKEMNKERKDDGIQDLHKRIT